MFNLDFIILFYSFILNFLIIKVLFVKSKFLDYFFLYSKENNNLVPVYPGVSLVLSFSILAFFYHSQFIIYNDFMVILFSTIIVFILGFIDDMININTFSKILFQIILSSYIIFILEFDKILLLPFLNNYLFNYIALIFFILGIFNCINLIDGIDNLSAYLSIIISSFFILISFLLLYKNMNFIFFIIIGSMLSYLFYNNFISRVFLGDSGSLVLGWIFSITSLLFIKKTDNISVHIPLLILAVPAFDVIYVMISRYIKNKSQDFFVQIKNIFKGDYNHIHHSLIDLKFDNKNICLILSILSIFFSIIALILLVLVESFMSRSFIFIFSFIVYFLIRFKIDKKIMNY